MEIVNAIVEEYCVQHSTPEPPLLQQLNRDTHAQVLQARMLSGHFQGRFLAMLSHLIQPQFILEIGTYTGYSALCLAEGLVPNGKLLTIDINEELETFTRKYLEQSEQYDKIEYIIADAADVIPTLATPIDLVFIDADKTNYRKYYDLVFEKVKIGGYILSDNVLWDGKILDPKANDKKTAALKDFNDYCQHDPRTENILLPIRDGLMLSRKLS